MKFINFIKSLIFTEVKPTEEGAKIKRAIVDIEPVAEAPVVKAKRKKVAKKK